MTIKIHHATLPDGNVTITLKSVAISNDKTILLYISGFFPTFAEIYL